MASNRKATATQAPTMFPFLSLPPDVIVNIGLLLDFQQRLELGCVCKQLSALVRESSSLWSDLRFRNANAVNPRNCLTHRERRIAFVRQHVNAIRSLEMGAYVGRPTPGMAALLGVLSGATALRDLRILAGIGPKSLATCGRLRQLTALELGPISGPFDAEQLSSWLWGLTQLRSLRLRFDLERSRHTRQKSPPALFRLSALTHLSFGEQRPLQYDAPSFVIGALPAELFLGLRRLRYLQIFNCGVTSLPADVSLLTGLQSLSILSSTALPLPHLQLPAEISRCTALTSLQLSSADISQHMWQLPLRELTLDQTPVSISQSQHFSRLASLRSLRLCNRQPHNSADLGLYYAVNYLRVGPALTCLRLDGNSLTHVPAFQAAGQLLELDVKRNSLSAAACLPLAHLTKVRTLDLSFNEDLAVGDDGVGYAGVASMFASMPALCTLGLRNKLHWWPSELQKLGDIHRARSSCGPKLIRHHAGGGHLCRRLLRDGSGH